jgi:putative ABC transport system permease protein
VKLRNLETETGPTFYIPFRQNPFPTAARSSLLVVRTSMTGANTQAMLRRELAAIDDGQAIGPLRVVTDAISDSLSLRRFTTGLTLVLALLAVALAAMGVYGVVSFTVSAQEHDIGVRAALGAQQHQVLWWVLRQGVALAALGIVIGFALSAVTRQLLARVLFGLTATDAATWTSVALLLITIAAAGCYVPARRASRIDPVTALRQE